MAIAGQLHDAATKVPPGNPDMYAPNIRLFANLQIWLCFVALILTIRFGIIGMNEAHRRKAATPPTVTMTCTPCTPGPMPARPCSKEPCEKNLPSQRESATAGPTTTQPTPPTRTTT